MMKIKPSQISLREKIIDVASTLFYEKGIHAVGIDEIVAQAGIAKMTLYKYFLSKDQLILAVLQRNEEQWWSWFEPAVKKRSKSASKRLLAIFDALGEWLENDSYRGSPFINGRIQVAETMYPIHLVTTGFRERLHEYILDLAQLAEMENPTQIADQFMMLIIGANVAAVTENATRRKMAIRLARKTAEALIKENEPR